MSSCQICERTIKANNAAGIIAHHGYQRPHRGSGWQTDSCWGARRLPYEQSCDAIPEYLEHVKSYVENQRRLIKALVENPPETISYSYGRGDKEVKTLQRPDDFDAKKNVSEDDYTYRGSWTYESEHYSQYKAHEREIRNGEREIARMEKRLANWKKQA